LRATSFPLRNGLDFLASAIDLLQGEPAERESARVPGFLDGSGCGAQFKDPDGNEHGLIQRAEAA